MQDIRDELAHCIGALEGVATCAVVNDVIDRLVRVHSNMSQRAPKTADVPADAARANLVDHRLAAIEHDIGNIWYRIEETAAALRETVANPNLHPSVKLLADTIAINLLAGPATDEETTR